MARDYSTRRSSRKGNKGPKQMVSLIVTFLLGYFTAAVVDLQTVTHWLNTQVLANHEAKSPQNTKAAAQQAKVDIPKPKFEFYTLLANEKGVGAAQTASAAARAINGARPNNPVVAHTAASTVTQNLTSRNLVAVVPGQPALQNTDTAKAPTQGISAQQTAAAKPNQVAISKQTYQIQVASFKARKEAEQMKGLLTLKGYEVYIVPISTPAKGNWFRVVVGPYASRDLAQRVQTSLAQKERLRGMISTSGA